MGKILKGYGILAGNRINLASSGFIKTEFGGMKIESVEKFIGQEAPNLTNR